MPKLTIEFNLPEEHEEHLIAVKSVKLYSFVNSLLRELRSAEKYDQAFGDKILPRDRKVLERIRKWVWEGIGENGIEDLF